MRRHGTPSITDALAPLCARPIAHRGLHACGGPGAIENTVAAALAAVGGGYGIECDVQLSRDGIAMVFHDTDLLRLTGINASLADCNADEIAGLFLGDGSQIPTLATFLDAIDGCTPVFIEIKSEGSGDMRLADAVLDQVHGYCGPVALESFDPLVVANCRDAPCPIGLIGPGERCRPDPGALSRCDFLSWNIDHVASAAAEYPDLPRTAWTVRTDAQEAEAKASSAQIVFEGLRPR